ncbi:MAG: protein-glutamine glutaminase family protein, partial [Pseudomonadota bacterium]
KIFLFYTGHYKRTYHEGWWFHTAPVILVNNVPMVMDYLFMHGPVTIKEWTDEFIDAHTPCKVIHGNDNYINYKRRMVTYDDGHTLCLIRVVPMYYMEPNFLDGLDNRGEQISSFRDQDIAWARKGFSKTSY